MFFNKKISKLNKILNNYNVLFEMWKRESFNDDSIDEISFEKDNIKIIFEEDLRENITNLFIIRLTIATITAITTVGRLYETKKSAK